MHAGPRASAAAGSASPLPGLGQTKLASGAAPTRPGHRGTRTSGICGARAPSPAADGGGCRGRADAGQPLREGSWRESQGGGSSLGVWALERSQGSIVTSAAQRAQASPGVNARARAGHTTQGASGVRKLCAVQAANPTLAAVGLQDDVIPPRGQCRPWLDIRSGSLHRLRNLSATRPRGPRRELPQLGSYPKRHVRAGLSCHVVIRDGALCSRRRGASLGGHRQATSRAAPFPLPPGQVVHRAGHDSRGGHGCTVRAEGSQEMPPAVRASRAATALAAYDGRRHAPAIRQRLERAMDELDVMCARRASNRRSGSQWRRALGAAPGPEAAAQ